MPIVSIEAPAGLPVAKKKLMMTKINAALSESYGIDENMIFLREYPRENVAIAGALLSDASEDSDARARAS